MPFQRKLLIAENRISAANAMNVLGLDTQTWIPSEFGDALHGVYHDFFILAPHDGIVPWQREWVRKAVFPRIHRT